MSITAASSAVGAAGVGISSLKSAQKSQEMALAILLQSLAPAPGGATAASPSPPGVGSVVDAVA